jgi:hypothetical protein
VTGACNDVAGSLPDVPGPKEIPSCPRRWPNDVLNNLKDDIVSTMAAAGVAEAASSRRDLKVVCRPVRPNGWPRHHFLVLAAIQSIATRARKPARARLA